MLKVTTWSCAAVGEATASRMAWRREPAPVSLVLTTVKVAAWAQLAARERLSSQIRGKLNKGAPKGASGWGST
jgi:hypothetical protein